MNGAALIVGINEYEHTKSLEGCENDANTIMELLSRNQDGSPNLECKVLTGSITKDLLAAEVNNLFKSKVDLIVFYFAGHGALDDIDGYLITSEAKKIDDGFSMSTLLKRAKNSNVPQVVLVLDCCFAGSLGSLMPNDSRGDSSLREGMAILAACAKDETAREKNESGVFTTLVAAALLGGGRNILGDVTVGSIYSYVEKALGAFDQRPVFKAHLLRMIRLRKCNALVDSAIVRLLPAYFETRETVLPLDPSYEPSVEPRDEIKERTFKHFQTLRDARLLVPVDEQHLYYAAINSKACKLTPLGQFYWDLAKRQRV